jgi:hypothetical protein
VGLECANVRRPSVTFSAASPVFVASQLANYTAAQLHAIDELCGE